LLGKELVSVEEGRAFLLGNNHAYAQNRNRVVLGESEVIDLNFNPFSERAFRQAVSLAVIGVPYGPVNPQGDLEGQYSLDCVESIIEWGRSFGVTINGDTGDKWYNPAINLSPLTLTGNVSLSNRNAGRITNRELLSNIKPGDIVNIGNNNAGYQRINALHNGVVVALIKNNGEVVDFVLAHTSGSYNRRTGVPSGEGWVLERGVQYMRDKNHTHMYFGSLSSSINQMQFASVSRRD
jgi:hypothetical protein